MKIKRTKVSVTVSRTMQVQQFQPSTVTVTEEALVAEGEKPSEVKEALYESASKSVRTFMKAEIRKWKQNEKE